MGGNTLSAIELDEDRQRYLKEKGLDAYLSISTIRKFELEAVRLAEANLVAGGLHTAIGQEASAVGICQALSKGDSITSTHRAHAHCIAKGMSPEPIMAELLGRVTGFGKGRSGTMHVASKEWSIIGANGIVGGGIPIAVGAGLQAQVLGKQDIAVTFFGEGAVAQGVFHESLNLAALWNLPVVFVCENNQYAEMAHYSLHMSQPEIWKFADTYGIPGVRVDGNDAFAVNQAAGIAVARARAGGGPTLIECWTYRIHGHFEGDAQRYRTKEEVASWREKDPLSRLKKELLEFNVATQAELDDLDQRAAKIVADAIENAQNAPVATDRNLIEMDVLAP